MHFITSSCTSLSFRLWEWTTLWNWCCLSPLWNEIQVVLQVPPLSLQSGTEGAVQAVSRKLKYIDFLQCSKWTKLLLWHGLSVSLRQCDCYYVRMFCAAYLKWLRNLCAAGVKTLICDCWKVTKTQYKTTWKQGLLLVTGV